MSNEQKFSQQKAEKSGPSISGTAHLVESPLNLIAIREHARKELAKLLDRCKGEKKGLVLDKRISGALGLIAEVSLLKAHGVADIYYLLRGPLNTECDHIIYLVRPSVDHMSTIAEQIQIHGQRNDNKQYTIYFVPKMTILCERVLDRKGVLGDVTTGEYHMDLIAVDDDVMTMALDNCFSQCFVDGDPSSLFYVAQSVMKLQSMFGVIPSVKAKGNNANAVLKLIKRLRKEEGEVYSLDNTVPEIDSLILLDRNVDMISPFLTQHTYEGLIDEVFGIENSFVELQKELLGKQAAKGKGTTRKLVLNNSDSLFKEIRNSDFAALGPTLHDRAEYIQEAYKEKDRANTIAQISKFMKKFKNLQQDHQLLTVHINLAEKIREVTKKSFFRRRLDIEIAMLMGRGGEIAENFVEECIAKEIPVENVLRLLCILSISNNGIRAKKYDFLKREIIQTYGYDLLFTLFTLEKLQLIMKRESFVAVSGIWGTIRARFRLIKDPEELQYEDRKIPPSAGFDGSDLNYIYEGYSPLSVRLIEHATKPGGWRSIEEHIRLLPGEVTEDEQELAPNVTERYRIMQSSANPERRNPVTVVYFIGGVTYSEISAIRLLSKREGHNRDYIIATTKLVNGNKLMSEIVTKLQNNLDSTTL